jgi:hypothetical protein
MTFLKMSVMKEHLSLFIKSFKNQETLEINLVQVRVIFNNCLGEDLSNLIMGYGIIIYIDFLLPSSARGLGWVGGGKQVTGDSNSESVPTTATCFTICNDIIVNV